MPPRGRVGAHLSLENRLLEARAHYGQFSGALAAAPCCCSVRCLQACVSAAEGQGVVRGRGGGGGSRGVWCGGALGVESGEWAGGGAPGEWGAEAMEHRGGEEERGAAEAERRERDGS